MRRLDNTISIDVAKTEQNLTTSHIGKTDCLYGIGNTCTITTLVLFVPNLRQNLLLAGRIEKAGLKIVFNDGTAVISNNGTVIAIHQRKVNLYEIIFDIMITFSNIKNVAT